MTGQWEAKARRWKRREEKHNDQRLDSWKSVVSEVLHVVLLSFKCSFYNVRWALGLLLHYVVSG